MEVDDSPRGQTSVRPVILGYVCFMALAAWLSDDAAMLRVGSSTSEPGSRSAFMHVSTRQ